MHTALTGTVAALGCAGAVLGLVAPPTAEATVTVRVRGSTRIEARVSRGPGRIELRGTLKDDAGTPVPAAQVHIGLAGVGGGQQLLGPRACPQMPPVWRGDSDVLAGTDDLGRFCLGIDPAVAGSVVELWFSGSNYHDPSDRTRLLVDLSKRSVKLSFSPRPRYLSLDRSRHAIHVDARVDPPDEPVQPLQLKLLLVPRSGERRQLGSGSVRPGQPTRFEVDSSALGEPGPATLAVSFAGSDLLQASEHSAVIERTIRVSLSLAGRVVGAQPTQGIAIPVAVGCSLGAVPSGAVEAVVGGKSVGTARVAAGSAQVVAAFEAAPGSDAVITLRYLPDAPWWRAGPPLQTTISVAHPSPWRLWPWALSLALVAAWVLRGWRRAPRPERRRAETAAGQPSGRASIEVLERGPARSGWSGRIVDAHEGTAIAGAVLEVIPASFAPAPGARLVRTNEQGQFTLAPLAAGAEGARLRATARWYAELVRPLPAPGHIQINLVTRRRALLNRLVDWTERMGYPWRKRGEPTPGEVRGLADAQGLGKIAAWAGAVEKAAFGADPLDEAREQTIRRQEPHWKAGADTSR
jgi:hypothetical protein